MHTQNNNVHKINDIHHKLIFDIRKASECKGTAMFQKISAMKFGRQ